METVWYEIYFNEQPQKKFSKLEDAKKELQQLIDYDELEDAFIVKCEIIPKD